MLVCNIWRWSKCDNTFSETAFKGTRQCKLCPIFSDCNRETILIIMVDGRGRTDYAHGSHFTLSLFKWVQGNNPKNLNIWDKNCMRLTLLLSHRILLTGNQSLQFSLRRLISLPFLFLCIHAIPLTSFSSVVVTCTRTTTHPSCRLNQSVSQGNHFVYHPNGNSSSLRIGLHACEIETGTI